METKLKNQTIANTEGLREAIQESPVVEYMVKNNLPLTKEVYVSLNTPEYNADNLPADMAANIPEIFQSKDEKPEVAASAELNALEKISELDKILDEQGMDAAIKWADNWLNS